jgi:hypothetical protein
LNPIQIKKETYHDVIRLFADTRKMQMRIEKAAEEIKQNPQAENRRNVERRPAGDSWF